MTTGPSDLLSELNAGVSTLTLNRPSARNALSAAMLAALGQQLAMAETKEAVKCVVLTGAGQGFCAGGDVKGMAKGDAALNSDGIDSTIYAQRFAQRATAGPSVAYRYVKENLNRAIAGEVEDCLDLEATHHIHCSGTADHREAAQAFVNKREPVFKGR
jgi:enoyl-CoA hydratase/carnithine racemase